MVKTLGFHCTGRGFECCLVPHAAAWPQEKAERRPRGAWFSKGATVLDPPPHSVAAGGVVGRGLGNKEQVFFIGKMTLERERRAAPIEKLSGSAFLFQFPGQDG